MAIDYGTKRTGLAVTDALGTIALPLETVPTHTLLDYLKQFLAREEVEALVLGKPTRLDGVSDTHSSAEVRGIERKLKETFPSVPLHLIDERMTSKMAQRSMIEGGASRKQRRDKGQLDRLAATILLQDFLDRRAR